MALLFTDSFDHYVFADMMEKWTSYVGSLFSSDTSGIIAGAGRRGSAALRLSLSGPGVVPSVAVTLPVTGAKAVVGFAFASVGPFSGLATGGGAEQPGASSPTCLLAIRSAGFTNVMIRLNLDGTLTALRASGINSFDFLGTTSAPLVQAVYTYIEVSTVIDATVGSVVIRFNGAVVMNVTGKNTLGFNGATGWNSIRLGPFNLSSGNPEFRYDDLYVSDGSGVAPWNDFLGDCRVDALLPTGPGATTGWSPSTGANWQCVDDPAPNDDTDYTATSTLNVTDTFVLPDLAAGSTVLGVQHCLSAKKSDAGIATIAPVIRHGGVDYVGTGLNPNTGYNVLRQVAQVNPGTSAAWTLADLNAAEFGYKRTA